MPAAAKAMRRKKREISPVKRQRSTTLAGEANIERILDAALSVFSREGFSGARVDAIANIAGLSKPNLLYYFRTKEDLYLAVLRRMLDTWLAPFDRMDIGDDPHSALQDYITMKLIHARDYPEASRLFAMEIMRGAPIIESVLAGELKDMVDRKVGVLRRWMAAGLIPKRDPHHLIFMIWATTQHYADFSKQIETLTGRTLADPAFFASARRSVFSAVLGEAKRAE